MIVRTGPNQTLDVNAAAWAGNINAPGMLLAGAQGPTFGTPQAPGLLTDPFARLYQATPGDWYRVPDSAIIGQPTYSVPGFGITKFLVYGGSMIALDPEEVNATSDLLNAFRGGNFTYTNCSVKLTRNTAEGLIALGVVRRADVDPIISSRPQEPTRPVTTQQAVSSASTAILALAIVGALIYFVPKDILR